MRQNMLVIALTYILLSTLLLVACGSVTGNSAPAVPTVSTPTGTVQASNPTASANSAPASPTASAVTPIMKPNATATGATPTSTRPANTGVQPPPSTPPPASGDVTLLLSKSSYTSSESIVVTIHNGLANNIMAVDHQSACTEVMLQMQTANGSWQIQDVCHQGAVTRTMLLPAGMSLVQTLAPQAGTFSRSTTWTKGQYRLVFTFSTAPLNAMRAAPTDGNTIRSVYSPVFTIG